VKKRGLGGVGVVLGSGAAFALVLVLVWAMVLREGTTRRLYLEYEAYRASAAFLDSYRESPELVVSDERVLGFGVYGADGTALVRTGTAPSSFRPSEVSSAKVALGGEASFVMSRIVGLGAADMPGRGRMQRLGDPSAPQSMPMGPGMGRGYGYGRMGGEGRLAPAAPGDQGADPARQPRALWMEYDLGGFGREQAILFAGASAASLAIVGLYALLLSLFRRNAELAERESRNRELVQLGEAARTLVHEIKNPLGIIRVQAASLRRLEGDDAAAKAAKKGEAIDEEVTRLAGLADRIREFLKGGEGEPVELELAPWLRDFVARYAKPEGDPAIELASLDERARARVDPERLALALGNLAANALEAAPDGRAPEISLAARGRHWEIAMADRGPGVPEELVSRLFEPFFTTKARGSGIGLALARRIARAAGGELEYRPRPEGGAIFSMLLPRPH